MPFLTNPYRFGFNPKSISGLVLWLDASDASTVFESTDSSDPAETGDTVGYWMDKSDQGNHVTQGTAANRPTYVSAGLNSLNTISFDGSNDYMDNASPAGFSALAGHTLYMVYSRDSNSSNRDAFSVFDTGPTDAFRLRGITDGRRQLTVVIGGVAETSAVSGTAVATFLVSKGWYDGTNQRHKISGGTDTDPASGNTNTLTSPTLRIGASSATVEWNGDIAEFLFWDNDIGDTNRSLVETYISNKWGITPDTT